MLTTIACRTCSTGRDVGRAAGRMNGLSAGLLAGAVAGDVVVVVPVAAPPADPGEGATAASTEQVMKEPARISSVDGARVGCHAFIYRRHRRAFAGGCRGVGPRGPAAPDARAGPEFHGRMR